MNERSPHVISTLEGAIRQLRVLAVRVDALEVRPELLVREIMENGAAVREALEAVERIEIAVRTGKADHLASSFAEEIEEKFSDLEARVDDLASADEEESEESGPANIEELREAVQRLRRGQSELIDSVNALAAAVLEIQMKTRHL